MNWMFWRNIARKKRMPPTKSNGRSANRPRRCCLNRESANSLTPLSRVLRIKAPGPGCSPFRLKGKVVQGFEGLDVGDRVRVQLMSINVERGFIDFKTVGQTRH